MKKSRLSELWVGIVAFLAVLIFTMAVFMIGREQQLLETRYELKATFERVAGLRLGAPVRLSGVTVGMVKEINLLPTQKKVEVVLSIKKDVSSYLRKDSLAQVLTLGLLGDKYVELSMGSAGMSVLASGDFLLSKEPVEFVRVVEQFSPVLLRTETILTGFLPILKNTEAISISLNKIFSDIANRKGTLGELVSDRKAYEEMVEAIASAGFLFDSLNEVFDDFKKTPFYQEFIKASAEKKNKKDVPVLQKLPESDTPLGPESVLP